MGLFNRQKVYMVYETVIVSSETISNHTNTIIDTIWGKISATNEDEAIGKFIKNSQHIKAKQRFRPKAVEWDKHTAT